MKILRGDQIERFKRFLQNIQNLKRKRAVIEMLNRGENVKEISKRTGLPVDKVIELKTQVFGKHVSGTREKLL